jgi:hypothetical protein
MSNDRRALLRRQLLKEQLAKEKQQPVVPVETLVEPDDGSEVDAALAGAAQGATFGFSDELGAGVDVASDLLSGQTSDLGAKWRKYQQEREAINKKLAEESPWAYGSGEVGAGLATSLIPGAGVAKGLGLAARLARTAKVGALAGGAYGLGASEGKIEENPEQLVKDTISGASMGLISGGLAETAGAGAGKAVKAGKEFIEDTDFLRQVEKSFDYGKKGLNLGSSKTMDKISLVPGQRAEDLVNNIYRTDKMLGEQVGAALDAAQQSGVKINVDPAIQDSASKIFQNMFVENPTLAQILDPKTSKLLKTIAQREVGDLTPIEARALKDELYKLTDNLAGFNSDQANFAKKVGIDLARSIDESLKTNIPDYRVASEQFKQFRELVPETIISKGTPTKLDKVYMGDLKNPELKLYEASEELLKKAKLPGEAAAQERATFEKLRRNLDQLKTKNPEASSKLGPDLYGKLKSQSDELAMIRQAQGFDPQEGPKGVFGGAISGLVTTGRGLSITAANKAGLAAKPVSKIYNASNDQLLNMASQLKGQKATSMFGDRLEKALLNKDEAAKNAVLFQLMQSPEYRGLIKNYFGEEDSNE